MTVDSGQWTADDREPDVARREAGVWVDAGGRVHPVDQVDKVDGVDGAAGASGPGEPDNSHYTYGGIEPWDFIAANGLDFFEGSVIKYVTRWRRKGGVEDLRKARVYVERLIQLAAGQGRQGQQGRQGTHKLSAGVAGPLEGGTPGVVPWEAPELGDTLDSVDGVDREGDS